MRSLKIILYLVVNIFSLNSKSRDKKKYYSVNPIWTGEIAKMFQPTTLRFLDQPLVKRNRTITVKTTEPKEIENGCFEDFSECGDSNELWVV